MDTDTLSKNELAAALFDCTGDGEEDVAPGVLVWKKLQALQIGAPAVNNFRMLYVLNILKQMASMSYRLKAGDVPGAFDSIRTYLPEVALSMLEKAFQTLAAACVAPKLNMQDCQWVQCHTMSGLSFTEFWTEWARESYAVARYMQQHPPSRYELSKAQYRQVLKHL